MLQLSVITINYNNFRGLEKTMQSVFKQKFKNFEYIVIDGGSGDESKTFIEKHSHNLSYWVSERDTGIYNAMNKGIMKAKGKYLMFLNSGDYLVNEHALSSVFEEEHDAGILYGDILIENGTIRYPDNPDFTFLFRDSIGHPAAFIKKELFDIVGMYNENNRIVSDWEFFLDAIIRHKVSYKHISKLITYFDSDGMSSKPENINAQLAERSKVLNNYFTTHYPELLHSFNEMEKELNRYKNSRAIGLLQKLMNSKLYRLFNKG